MTKKFMVNKFNNATSYMQLVEQQGEVSCRAKLLNKLEKRLALHRGITVEEYRRDREIEEAIPDFNLTMTCGPYGDEG